MYQYFIDSGRLRDLVSFQTGFGITRRRGGDVSVMWGWRDGEMERWTPYVLTPTTASRCLFKMFATERILFEIFSRVV